MKRRYFLAGIAMLPLASCGGMTPAFADDGGRPLTGVVLIPHHSTSYWKQIAAAEGFAYREHKRLLAEGWQWDGMDGYSK